MTFVRLCLSIHNYELNFYAKYDIRLINVVAFIGLGQISLIVNLYLRLVVCYKKKTIIIFITEIICCVEKNLPCM